MQAHDLPAVLALQARCYAPEFHEPHDAFASKLQASPRSCWVLAGRDGLLAYLVSLPIEGDQLPKLHARTCPYPARPDWLYVHDMAVAPEARGSGASTLLLGEAFGLARSLALPQAGLIAVQGSLPYWVKQGFRPVVADSRVERDKLASFGADARFMVRDIPGA